MKRLLVIAVGVLILVGCGSSGENNVVNYNNLPIESYDLYDDDNFRMQYPKDWDLIEGDEVGERYRSNAEIVLVSKNKDAFFTPNIVVERMSIESGDSLEAVYDDVWETNKQSLLIAEEIGRNRFTTIANGQVANGLIVEFSGKRKLEGDVLTYLQSLVIVGEEAVLATAAFDELDTDNQSTEILEALKTLAIK